MDYVAFNLKTDYSLLGSLIKMEDFFNFSNENNIKFAAICDNNLAGAIEFYNNCKKQNITFSIGLELECDDVIIFLYAMNEAGYKNLLKINTLKEKNNLTIETLSEYSHNIKCVVDYEHYAKSNLSSLFENVFVGYNDEYEKSLALKITNNVIFNRKIKSLKKEDSPYLKYLNEIGGLNNLSHLSNIEKINNQEMIEYEKFFSNINIEFEKSKLYIPEFSQDDETYLKKLSLAGLKKRMGENLNDTYINRLNYELSVISEMGFTSYFLIVYDYVLFAKKNNILVGPGRGSAAGSLVCYSIGITDIDPITYNLLFERFLNKDRITMPDIDIDFDSEKRDVIINYVREKYGNESVAIGSTYNTLKSKLVLREVGKILKVDEVLFEKFLRVINRNLSLKENLENEKIIKYLKTYEILSNVYKVSMKLENLKKNVSTHAAGVVICSRKLDDIIPVMYTNEVCKTGISMDYLENLGILKMDFLGLKNLTIISNILKKIDINLNEIQLNDESVLKIFSEAKTDGIFQFETFAMKDLLIKVKPKNFDELVAAVALVRPGANAFLEEYIYNRDSVNSIVYPKYLKSVLEETYGIVLYQEQIIKILNIVGDFSNSEADNVRRAISKKSSDIIIKSRELFIKNAIKNNYLKNEAEELFSKIERFADYGFNKSHSVAYALIGYQMAYLKKYYEVNFVRELLRGSKDIKFIEGYINEIKSKNISVLKPDVNYSKKDFEIINNKLMLPLNLIKGISGDIENNILVNSPYEDVFDFCIKNINLKRDIIENLIYAGALRSFKIDSNTLINNLDRILNYASLNLSTSKPLLQDVISLSSSELSKYEYSMFGFYISNHPSSKYKSANIMKLINKNEMVFNNVLLYVKIENIKNIKTKKGDDMAFMKVSDETYSEDIVVFSDVFSSIKNIVVNDFVKINAKVTKNKDKISIVLSNIEKVESEAK